MNKLTSMVNFNEIRLLFIKDCNKNNQWDVSELIDPYCGDTYFLIKNEFVSTTVSLGLGGSLKHPFVIDIGNRYYHQTQMRSDAAGKFQPKNIVNSINSILRSKLRDYEIKAEQTKRALDEQNKREERRIEQCGYILNIYKLGIDEFFVKKLIQSKFAPNYFHHVICGVICPRCKTVLPWRGYDSSSINFRDRFDSNDQSQICITCALNIEAYGTGLKVWGSDSRNK